MINAENIPARDRIFKIAYGSEAHPEEIEKMALALLALMDAKPVAWQWLYYKQWHVTNDEERARDVAWMGEVEVQPLYWMGEVEVQPLYTVTMLQGAETSKSLPGIQTAPELDSASKNAESRPGNKKQITSSMAKEIAFKLGAELNNEEADIFADGYNAALLAGGK